VFLSGAQGGYLSSITMATARVYIYMYIYIYTHTYIYIYIYWQRMGETRIVRHLEETVDSYRF